MTVTTSQDEQLGAAIGAIPSGLFVVTSQQNGKTAAMLASWYNKLALILPLQQSLLLKADQLSHS